MPKFFRIFSAVLSAGLAGSLLVWPAVTVDGRGLLLVILAVGLAVTADRGASIKRVEDTEWTRRETAASRPR